MVVEMQPGMRNAHLGCAPRFSAPTVPEIGHFPLEMRIAHPDLDPGGSRRNGLS